MKLTNQQKKQVLEEIRQVLISEKRTHIKNFRLKDKALNRCTGLCTISEMIFRKYFNLNLMRSEIPELSYLYKVWIWHDQDYDSRIKFIDHMLIFYSIDLNGTSTQRKSHEYTHANFLQHRFKRYKYTAQKPRVY
jgi:hypothetical protein